MTFSAPRKSKEQERQENGGERLMKLFSRRLVGYTGVIIFDDLSRGLQSQKQGAHWLVSLNFVGCWGHEILTTFLGISKQVRNTGVFPLTHH